MRGVAGFLALQGLVLAPGIAFLLATGLVSLRVRCLAAAAGAAYLAGIASTSVVAIVLLVAGGSLTAPAFTAIAVALCLVFAAVYLLRRHRAALEVDEDESPGGFHPLAVGLAVAIAVFLVVQALDSLDVPTAWDAAHNWTLKAVTLLNDGDLRSGVFRDDGLFAGSHPAYPILHPVFESVVFRFAASANQGVFVAELWIMLGAFVSAVAYLLRPRGIAAALVLAPLGIVVASGAAGGTLRGDADVTMAVFLGVAALALALWVERGRGGHLALGALCLAAAANVKNEGIAFAVVMLAVAAGAVLWRRSGPRELVRVALAGVFLVLTLVPWRLWVADHGPFRSDVASASDVFDPGYLADRIHQLDIGARWVLTRALEGASGWLIPAFLALAVVLAAGRAPLRAVPRFYLAVLLGMVAALLVVYWTSPQPDIAAHVERTSLRTITGPLLVAAAALAHLLAPLRWPPPELTSAGRETKSSSAASS